MQASVESKQVTAEALAQQLTALMKHLLKKTGPDFFAELEKAGLSLTQVKSLAVLIDGGKPLSVKALSDALGLSVPGVSRAIELLVQRGDLNREEDPRDRRSKLVSVTPRGRRTHERLMATRVAGVRRFVEELDPEEQQALARGLSALAGRLNR